jgi:pimeloyl-ACP methyl ester carboxylesterase
VIWNDIFLSRDTQSYVFSSEGTVHFTLLMFILCGLYFVFGPKDAVLDSTVGDEGDNDEPNAMRINGEGGRAIVSARQQSPRRVEWVDTPLGKVRVTIVGDESKRGKLITFHDVGLNHYSCFGRFFGPAGMRRGELRDTKVWDQFCVYHIDAPGHTEEADDLETAHLAPGNGGRAKDKDGEAGGMTMGALAGVVERVVADLKIGAFVGFGVGAGANVLLRFAMRKPAYVHALILVGANARAASSVERWYYWTTLQVMARYGMNDYAQDLWARLHYSAALCGLNGGSGSHQVRTYRQVLRTDLNQRNLAAYLHAYEKRTALDTSAGSRAAAKNAAHDPVLKAQELVQKLRGTKVLLVCAFSRKVVVWWETN